MNVCLALNIHPWMDVFLHFFTFSWQVEGIDQAICCRRSAEYTSGVSYINCLPTNYHLGSWKEKFLFINVEFLHGSRKRWINLQNRLYVKPPTLSDLSREMVWLISKTCRGVNCPGGVPYSLCQNPDFFFEDMYKRKYVVVCNLLLIY